MVYIDHRIYYQSNTASATLLEQEVNAVSGAPELTLFTLRFVFVFDFFVLKT